MRVMPRDHVLAIVCLSLALFQLALASKNHTVIGEPPKGEICTSPVECSYKGHCRNGRCNCFTPYKGIYCNETEPCGPDSGLNCGVNGMCESRTSACICKDGWIGDRCDISLCNGNGVFRSKTGTCRCLEGFSGKFCDECATGPDMGDPYSSVTTTTTTTLGIDSGSSVRVYLCCPSRSKQDNSTASSHVLFAVKGDSVGTYMNLRNGCLQPGTDKMDCACRQKGLVQAKIGEASVSHRASNTMAFAVDAMDSITRTYGTPQMYADAVDVLMQQLPATLTCTDPVVNTTGFIIFVVITAVGAFSVIVVVIWVVYMTTKGYRRVDGSYVPPETRDVESNLAARRTAPKTRQMDRKAPQYGVKKPERKRSAGRTAATTIRERVGPHEHDDEGSSFLQALHRFGLTS
jgi:hypothetical protein